MSPIIGVIADDFTGACDVSVQFRKNGLETVVLTDVKGLHGLKPSFDIVVIDTETRNIASRDAYNKIRQTLKNFRKLGIKLFYKKVDSTLRGNIGAELEAVLDELEFDGILLAPSYPHQGRTVVNGQVFVKGVPLGETEFAFDLVNPVKESYVQKIIRLQSNRKIGLVDLFIVRKGLNEARGNLKKLLEEGYQIIVADAETQEDLDIIGDVSIDLNILLCGSAGLAQNMVSSLACKRQVIVVTGSVNGVTLNQIEAAHDKLGIPVLEPNLTGILTDDEKFMTAAVNLTDKAVTILQGNRDVIIRLAGSKDVVQKIMKAGESLGLSHVQITEKLLSILSQAVKEIADHYRIAGLVFIGGDTSIRIIDAIGAKGVRIEAEILPGIPVGRILGGEHEGTLVVTKAGGFGDSQTLVKVIQYMRNPKKIKSIR